MPTESDTKHIEPRLPTYSEATAEEQMMLERTRLMTAVVEMDRFKSDMEAKIRQEMEHKIRHEMEQNIMASMYIEMETKMKDEMEAIVKAQEAKRVFEEMKQKRQQAILDEDMKLLINNMYPLYIEALRVCHAFLEKERPFYHIIMNTVTEDNLYIMIGNTRTLAPTVVSHMRLYISATHVGIFRYQETQVSNRTQVFPIYHFDAELTPRDFAILNQITQYETKDYKMDPIYGNCSHIMEAVTNVNGDMEKIMGHFHKEAPLKNTGSNPSLYNHNNSFNGVKTGLEIVVRLIPGSYKNGPWKALNGFFGIYFNEETLELSHHAPSMEII